MIRFTIIGSSTPLQKCLGIFEQFNEAEVCGVFLDETSDTQSQIWCEKHHIPWFPAKSIGDVNGRSLHTTWQSDWLLSINSTVIVNEEVLKLQKNGGLNLHPGLLPEYAGLHTHQWAIRNQETEFGVTIHEMQSGIDTGDIVLQKKFPLGPDETGIGLYLKCLNEGTKLMKELIAMICNNQSLPKTHQDPSLRKLYTHKMAVNSELNFNDTAKNILAFVRAAYYEPFQSPSYRPLFQWQGAQYHLVQAVETDRKLACGQILIENQQMYIGTMTHAISVVKLRNSEGKKLDIKEMGN